jgi:hypothetical protein
MSPLLGVLAAPAAGTALDLASKAVECSAQPFAAMLEAAKRQFDKPPADAKSLLSDATTASIEGAGDALDLQSLFASIGL